MNNYDEIEAERKRFIAVFRENLHVALTSAHPYSFVDEETDFLFTVWLEAKRDAKEQAKV